MERRRRKRRKGGKGEEDGRGRQEDKGKEAEREASGRSREETWKNEALVANKEGGAEKKRKGDLLWGLQADQTRVQKAAGEPTIAVGHHTASCLVWGRVLNVHVAPQRHDVVAAHLQAHHPPIDGQLCPQLSQEAPKLLPHNA